MLKNRPGGRVSGHGEQDTGDRRLATGDRHLNSDDREAPDRRLRRSDAHHAAQARPRGVYLGDLDLAGKLAITALLLVLSVGFAVSEAYTLRTLEPADGRPGLGLADITATYHGQPGASALSRQVAGGMKRYFSALEDPTRLVPAEQADIAALLAWSRYGAPEVGYWDPVERRKKPGPILGLLSRHGCLQCHSATSTTIGNKRDSPLDSYAAILRFTRPDSGVDPARLLRLSHVHLLGMGLLFAVSGLLVALTRFPLWLRVALATTGPLAVLLTVGGWWAVKLAGAAAAPLALAGGVLAAAAWFASVAAVLYDLFLLAWRGAGVRR